MLTIKCSSPANCSPVHHVHPQSCNFPEQVQFHELLPRASEGGPSLDDTDYRMQCGSSLEILLLSQETLVIFSFRAAFIFSHAVPLFILAFLSAGAAFLHIYLEDIRETCHGSYRFFFVPATCLFLLPFGLLLAVSCGMVIKNLLGVDTVG